MIKKLICEFLKRVLRFMIILVLVLFLCFGIEEMFEFMKKLR